MRQKNDIPSDQYVPFYTKEVQKEALLMINEYGSQEAELKANSSAQEAIKEINTMLTYDEQKVDRLDKQKWFWLTVASAIRQSRKNDELRG